MFLRCGWCNSLRVNPVEGADDVIICRDCIRHTRVVFVRVQVIQHDEEIRVEPISQPAPAKRTVKKKPLSLKR